ncbi:MAG: type I pullulanase [Acholeplasmatales bacterium]|nr:MAG: type I pullulanase [Acholeplasmatales bacterium]
MSFYAYLEDFHEITVIIPHQMRRDPVTQFEAHGNDEEIPLEIASRQTLDGEDKYVLRYDSFIRLNKIYHIFDDQGNKTELYTGKIVRTELFDDLYYYDGPDLGHRYGDTSTTFKIWSPVAKYLKVELTTPDGEVNIYPMTYKKIGVWQITLDGDLDGYKYRFISYVNGKEHTFTDPYGIASTANGTHNYVVNPDKFVPFDHARPPFSGRMPDAILYEMSIRDLTSDPSIKATHPGTFHAACEEGLKTPAGNPAGFDYVKDLGVTHVQLLPVFDFEGVDETKPFESYNWGYNPAQYNVPEGSYATNPDDPYARINELRTLVDRYHGAGLRVVMDVVYNHVYNVKTFPFEKIIPGYAYRVDSQGILTNGSGCDSDLATERKMIRKFISDSVMYWTKTYKMDGFRFDLMGLIDMKTMNMIRQKLEVHRPDLILYGEGWNMPAPLPAQTLAHMYNKKVLYNIGFFNDRFREYVKGATFNPKHRGYALGELEHLAIIKLLILGSVKEKFLFRYPGQSINYVACHDNHTLHDKIKLALPDATFELRARAQQLATGMVLLAQGVPFIHMGQEFYRTKQGEENSYKSPDAINRIDWSLIDKHQTSIHQFKTLIKLRKSLTCLRLPTASAIKKNGFVSSSEHGTTVLEVCRDKSHTIVIFKPRSETETLSFDDPFTVLYSSASPESRQGIRTLKLDTVSVTVLVKSKKESEAHG